MPHKWWDYDYSAAPVIVADDLIRVVYRLDGSAEPANEILEQTSHERPLVAQTYSTAIAKGKTSTPCAGCSRVKPCVTCTSLHSFRLLWGSGSSGWSWRGGRHERPAPGRRKRTASINLGDRLRSLTSTHSCPRGRKQIMELHFRGGAFPPPLALLRERG